MTNSSRLLALVIVTPVYGDDYKFQTIPEAIEFITTHKQKKEAEDLKFLEYRVVLEYKESPRHINGWFPDKQDAVDFLETLKNNYH